MINVKVLPLSVNADNETRMLQPTEVLNIENMRVSVSEDGKNFQIKNFPSTQLLYNQELPYNNLCIGTAKDLSRQRLFGLIWNDYGLHQIIAYDLIANITYVVLKSSQTSNGFNWDIDLRIDKNARVVGDLLIYTDNNNEPQCISIEAGIKLNHPSYVTDTESYGTPILYTTLTLIKRPPIFPLQVTKASDGGFVNNYIENNAYQFYVRYWYKNYHYSAMSAFSQLVPYNADGESSNYILVQMSFSEHIDDDIQAIDFCVRYGNYGQSFIVRTFDKAFYYDNISIQMHNTGTVQLALAFYDNITGLALDTITANTSFDNVALIAETIESARNRLFLANLLKGYDAPKRSSLTASLTSVDTGAGGSFDGNWGYVTLHANFIGGCQDSYMFPFVYFELAEGAPYQFYYFSSVRDSTIWNGGVGTVPSTINLNLATFKGATEAELITFLKFTQYPSGSACSVSGTPWQVTYEISYSSLGAVVGYLFLPVQVNQFFKSASDYEINIEFKDRFARKCGVVKDGVKVTIPNRTYTQTSFTQAIQWALSNTNALNEIPLFAYYYQIVIKKNQTTRFYTQIRASGMQYVVKDIDDGTYTYGNTYSATTTYAVAIDLTAFNTYGLGYTFLEGDFARVIKPDNTSYNLRVLGQEGNYVFVSPTDLGTGSATFLVFAELYTPYKPQLSEPYYETGDVYPVSNPGTVNRAYSTLTDTINGDTYALQRTDSAAADYIVEAMSPNDKVWQIWQTDTGFINFFDSIGQQQKETTIDHSDTYINGTKTNGLNKFGVLNSKDVGNSSGAITKLQLTNKQTEDGTVLLVITEYNHLSAYLQEVQLVASATNNSIVQTDEIIGTINALKNGRGSINGETTEEYNGSVWGISILQGVAWQYSNDGITDISDYGMNRFFDRYCKRYIANGYNTNNNPIHGVYDPSTDELLFMLPAVEEVSFPPNLPSYDDITPSYASSIKNRFDIYDGQPKIVIFKTQQNKWTGAYKFTADCFSTLGQKFYGFKVGNLYLHNEDFTSFNVVYGTQLPQRICLPINAINPSVIKDVMNIALEGNGNIPNYTVLYSEYPNIQITDLASTDTNADGSPKWENKEGVVSASFFKDRLSPNISGTAVQKMLEGDLINSATPMCMVEWQIYDSQLIINFINVGVLVSSGHTNIINLKDGGNTTK